LNRKVALKVISLAAARKHRDTGREKKMLQRFEREAKAVAALNHPSIVTIHSVDEAFGMRYITMEYVDGETLGESIPETGFGTDEFVSLGAQLAEAVSAAHKRGIVHRDLKPANVMMTSDRRIKVLDFGLAKLREQAEEEAIPAEELHTMSINDETLAGRVVGTPGYMSPEQLLGQETDTRSDVFALGILLYMMASGKHPFIQGDQAVAVMAVLQQPATSLSDLAHHQPPALAEVIDKCLRKEPDARYPSAYELLTDLRSVTRQPPTSA